MMYSLIKIWQLIERCLINCSGLFTINHTHRECVYIYIYVCVCVCVIQINR